MFCPECRVEYREGFTECADCKVSLVEELPPLASPPEREPEQSSLVTVLSTVNAATMALAKSILEDAKIRFNVRGELTKAMFTIGIMQIQVAKIDEKEARELLEGIEEKEGDQEQ
jgi:hypothetical protein